MNNKIPMINPELFTYELYEPNWWDALDLSFIEGTDVEKVFAKIREYAIGCCDGSRLTVRPRADDYAFMFEKDGNKFWFHIPKWEFRAPVNEI